MPARSAEGGNRDAVGRRGGRLLLIRFSALGDVVMLLPVLEALCRAYPEVSVVVLSRPFARELLGGQFSHVECFTADLKGRHRGLRGLWRLAKEVRALGPFTGVVDMHAVLRSVIVSLFLRVISFPRLLRVCRIDKGRAEKARLVRPRARVMQPLRHTVLRYADTLGRMGYPVEVPFRMGGLVPEPLPETLQSILRSAPRAVGVAPFAKHRGKCYPATRMLQLLNGMVAQGITPFIFGGGAQEIALMRGWRGKIPRLQLVPDFGLSLRGELSLMAALPLLLTMDSANMHLASWAGTPVLSIWGATHPYAGFLGWGQDPDRSVVQDGGLDCRPCSVFGDKACRFGHYHCLDIPPEGILSRILEYFPNAMPVRSGDYGQ